MTFPKKEYFAIECRTCHHCLAICEASRMPMLTMANLTEAEQEAVLTYLKEHDHHQWEAVVIELQQLAES